MHFLICVGDILKDRVCYCKDIEQDYYYVNWSFVLLVLEKRVWALSAIVGLDSTSLHFISLSWSLSHL